MAATMQQLKRDEIAHLISLGHVLVLKRRQVYRLNSWLARHPGGHLALLHFVGRDAANEIDAYHCDATLKTMRSFQVAEVDVQDWSEDLTGWKPLIPPVQAGKMGEHGRIQEYNGVSADWKADLRRYRESFAGEEASKPLIAVAQLEPPEPPAEIDPAKQYRMSRGWEDLHRRLVETGIYNPTPAWNYRVDMVRYIGLFLAFLWVFLHANQTCRPICCRLLLQLTGSPLQRALLRCRCPAWCMLASNHLRRARCSARRNYRKLSYRQSHWFSDCQLVWRTELRLVGRREHSSWNL